MKKNNIIKNFYDKFFKYTPPNNYDFFITDENVLDDKANEMPVSPAKDLEPQTFSNNLKDNLDFFKFKYNSLINSDIKIREFSILCQNTEYKAAIIYIDGMVDSKIINESVIKPLMIRNRANTYKDSQKEIIKEFNNNDIIIRKVKKFNLANYIYNHLIPQNDVEKTNQFDEALSGINIGNCILLIDTINICYNIDVKKYEQRNIDSPQNEIVIRGSQEAFVENIRTNTSLLRRLVNNENLIIENCTVGKITKTRIAVCYLKDIANNNLVAETKFRINNLDVDYLISSGQLEQLIQDNSGSLYPQMLATERPDKATMHLLEGRVVILVNGSPYSLVVPGVFSDFMSSPEDSNFKYQFANLLKLIRLIAAFFALFLPGIYVAITNYHQELLPTELLFTIEAARENVPFPTIIEILLMEIAFELIREAGLRVPSPIGPTIGIVGGIVLGDAAVTANLVSPVLIIIVAITAICSFSIPDFSLNFTIRICRFIYIFLGFMAGFLGIAVGVFIQTLFLCNLKSFGCPYLTPYDVNSNKRTLTSYFLPPIWKRENRSPMVNPKKKLSQGRISMLWKKNNI